MVSSTSLMRCCKRRVLPMGRGRTLLPSSWTVWRSGRQEWIEAKRPQWRSGRATRASSAPSEWHHATAREAARRCGPRPARQSPVPRAASRPTAGVLPFRIAAEIRRPRNVRESVAGALWRHCPRSRSAYSRGIAERPGSPRIRPPCWAPAGRCGGPWNGRTWGTPA